MNFPKNIFQTWKTEIVPDNWKNAQQSVITMNPNWKYTLLTDADNENIVKTYFPDFYNRFMSFKYPIQRADAIRYCVLYLYGGIYVDLDYMCNKSFDDIRLTNEVGLIKSSNFNCFTNSVLLSKQGSKFWLKAIEQMKQDLPWYKRISKHFRIMNSTGPLMIDKIAKNNKDIVQELTNIEVPCNVCVRDKCKADKFYYLTPIDGRTWNSWDTKIINIMYCNKDFLFFAILIILFIVIYKNKKLSKKLSKK
jgi:mannosyltransferase OCH1-like enzyme